MFFLQTYSSSPMFSNACFAPNYVTRHVDGLNPKSKNSCSNPLVASIYVPHLYKSSSGHSSSQVSSQSYKIFKGSTCPRSYVHLNLLHLELLYYLQWHLFFKYSITSSIATCVNRMIASSSKTMHRSRHHWLTLQSVSLNS